MTPNLGQYPGRSPRVYLTHWSRQHGRGHPGDGVVLLFRFGFSIILINTNAVPNIVRAISFDLKITPHHYEQLVDKYLAFGIQSEVRPLQPCIYVNRSKKYQQDLW